MTYLSVFAILLEKFIKTIDVMIKTRAIIMLSLLLVACGKDNSTTLPTTQEPSGKDTLTCKPTKVILSTDFDLSDTSPYSYTFVYNGASIQSLNRSVGNVSYTFLYNGTTPIKRDKVVSAGIVGTDSIFLTGSSVSNVRHYESGTLYDEIKYTYAGSAIAKKQLFHYGTTTSTSNNNYSYTGSLISKVERFSSSGSLYDSYTYTYGTQANKLFKQNVLIDLYLHLDEDLESVIYDGLFNNDTLISNVIYTEIGKSPVSYSITYDMNTNGYPINVKANGKTIISFEYDCAK